MDHSIIFFTAFNAVAPLVLVILLGYLLKRKGFLSREFLKTGNWLVFHVCLPCMLFINVYDIADLGAINWRFLGYCVAAEIAIFGLGLATAMSVTKVPERRGVIWQCSYRSNFAIIGLSLASALGGSEAVAVASVLSAVSIPLLNTLSVIALTTFVGDAGSGKSGIRTVLRGIAKNPLILGVAAGILFLGLRELQRLVFGEVVFSLKEDTKFLYTALSNLKAITSPFALLVLGGQFEFTAVRGLLKEITAGTLWRIVIAPALGIGGAVLLSGMGLLQCGNAEYPALIALFGSPVAVSSAVMAGSMGNDEQLATQLVVWTSIFSVVTVFAEAFLLMSTGLLAV